MNQKNDWENRYEPQVIAFILKVGIQLFSLLCI